MNCVFCNKKINDYLIIKNEQNEIKEKYQMCKNCYNKALIMTYYDYKKGDK